MDKWAKGEKRAPRIFGEVVKEKSPEESDVIDLGSSPADTAAVLEVDDKFGRLAPRSSDESIRENEDDEDEAAATRDGNGPGTVDGENTRGPADIRVAAGSEEGQDAAVSGEKSVGRRRTIVDYYKGTDWSDTGHCWGSGDWERSSHLVLVFMRQQRRLFNGRIGTTGFK
ncbi:uncharacterized protein CC84DRAFT_1223873 [Paraphaeosphaeria sporulosa]|uniref:Uncharacterized protein n=1 Tax=Paraphaeosphaeria sporulosa TaxID=1460663 RepID=A0A177CVU1_9PLEO|nr:uncharacterized protein CC84DRAFT_1223873 [Paraphaeosphaeria sporulosa]OAG11148.1 hypothetical protein CC84DRAFT_1223873 [Paraphaeosphaeria sporulosa]